ncbi:zinc-binding dehydrogenase [Microbacterium sp. X-17]|uniref:zinc-dependent alcohol dehydrogenase n=1 Tax=Microbacterium sp. X-17 TaxID=3144404 RepID=UPI0031F4CDC4
MRSVQVTGVGENGWAEVPEPEIGPRDVLLRIRACGVCGSDGMYSDMGGIPPHIGATRLGHEPAGEVVEIGAEVGSGIAIGDHVVIDVTKFADGICGSGGAQGGLTEYVVVKEFEAGRQLRVIPKEIPWAVAALNEPMAVAHHAVNRSGAQAGDRAVVFGAGPIGLGAVLSLKAKGVAHVVVVGRGGQRMQKALDIGADAVIDSTTQDVVAGLKELHGEAPDTLGISMRAGSDVYIDAAGSPAVIEAAMAAAKSRAVIVVVATHKTPILIDFAQVLVQEIDLRWSVAYPTEIFEVTDAIIANPDKYAQIISDSFPYDQALEALDLAKTPGAAVKVLITLD